MNPLSLEGHTLTAFQRRAHHYLRDITLPDSTNKMEWLALMQHHGAPTRLLDFTRSAHIAGFFALEDAHEMDEDDQYCAVWAVNLISCRYNALNRLQVADSVHAKLAKGGVAAYQSDYHTAMFHTPCSAAFVARPFRMNERLSLQQGIFLVPGNVTVSFEENLAANGGDLEKVVLKVEINRKVRLEALRELDEVNITRASLFPGLDGYAQSLKHLSLVVANIPGKGLSHLDRAGS